MQEFDLIVIGGGSGLDIASAAAQHGLKVAIIEKDRMGGTCLNRGCIPSKLLIHSANIAEIIKQSDTFGIKVNDFSIDFEKIMNRVNGITDSESDEIKKGLMQSDNPKLFAKECRFVGEKKIAFKREGKKLDGDEEDEIISAEKIVIASGTKPIIPKIKGLEETGYITSDEALRLKKQPQVLTIIGGGYVACELAHFFGSLGTKIHIIQRNNLLIPQEDEEISQKFTEVFSRKYNIHLGYNTESILKINNTNNHTADTFHVVAKNSSGEILEIDSDQLLVSTGRISNTESLDLDKSGIKINEKGFIIVDEYLETTMKGIFAIGDVVGKYLFKHNANLESQYAYNNIIHGSKKMSVDYTAMPHAIFSSPQVAGVGFTEQELRKKGTEYLKSTYPYIQTGMGEAIEDRDGFVKFLVDKNDRKILGCHIIGTDASTLIHEVLVTMRSGNGTIDSISNTIHIHPALSEVIARAASGIN
ncbi:dihydrolipoyl dehydrogenase family protein [Candidatus Nitrosocosmicus arcticus]|uniref:Putative dihydrolipoamide dehydrogenase n=1 Tax=Candidatus Nitrosocosmicus arcticus TaxID=2035267 RepID=A0A557SV10_9ARCH|nr:dihydrolipoyl dehydrogenase [Candidatus Nitrosocosmicus arcticus]TVP40438.1 putative dihydrolipoamide dehydrogenase [Candidatus Nitrosocosmicus arcticus]